MGHAPEVPLDALVAALPDYAYLIAADGVTVLACNAAFATSVGQPSPAACVGRSVHELLGAALGERLAVQTRQVLAHGDATFDERAILIGRSSFVHTAARRVTGPDGRVIGVLGVSREVDPATEDAVTQAASLADREARLADGIRAIEDSAEYRFARMMQVAAEGVMEYDRDRVIRFVNPAFARLVGYEPSELIGTSVDRLIPHDERARYLERFARRLAGDQTRFDGRLRHKDGRVVWASVSGAPYTDADGTVVGGVSVYVDIGERRAMEAEIRRANTRIEALFDALPVCVMVMDADGRVVRVNRALEAVGGALSSAPPPYLYDPSQWRLLDASGAPLPADQAPILRALRTRDPQPAREVGLVSPDTGQVAWYESAAAPLPDGGAIAAFSVVTDRRLAAERLETAERLEALGRLAGGVAHDFNNLLTAIVGGLDLAMSALDRTTPAYQDLVDARTAADRAGEVTAQLLAFARRDVVSPKLFDVRRVVHDTARLLRRVIGDQATLDVALPDVPVVVRADPVQLQQALVNLAVNARDAMPDGGVIRLRVTRDEAPDGPYVGPSIHGPTARIRVEDDGTGIAPEVLPRIFEPFFTTKPAGRGTGLGLAQVYGAVTQAGGAVWADSTLGRGSVFHLALPVADGVPDADAATPLPLDGTGDATILLVEDDDAVRSLTTRALGKAGFAVHAAPSGLQAVARATDLPQLDLVICDVVMPGLNGPQVVARLRERWPWVRVLFITGYTDDVLPDELTRGGDSLIPKPFAVSELVRRVRELLAA